MLAWKERSLNVIKAGIALTGFLCTFYIVTRLMLFLSHPQYGVFNKSEHAESSWTWALITNTLLVSIFALQHSVLTLQPVKDLFCNYGLRDIQRSIYIILTCVTLEILMQNWHYTNHIIWQFSMEHHSTYWFYMLIHTTSWLLIYVGSICMDINELLGMKQVYYALRGWQEPLSCKSLELQNLYDHMRHPSFVGFIAIFWFVPVMRLDRALLAGFLTLYMYITWKTDEKDLHYQKEQISRKFNSS